MHETTAWWPWVATLICLFIGCSSDSRSPSPDPAAVASVANELAAASSTPAPAPPAPIVATLPEFHDLLSADWTSTLGTLSRTKATEKASPALSLALPRGSTEVCSGALSLPWKRSDTVEFQLWMQDPTESFGEVRVVLRPDAPGATDVELAPVAIRDKAPGIFHRIVTSVESYDVVVGLDAPVRVCIVIDAEAGRYVLDGVRFTYPPNDEISTDTGSLASIPIRRSVATFSTGSAGAPSLSDPAPDALPETAGASSTAGRAAAASKARVPKAQALKAKSPKSAGTTGPSVALFELDDPDFCTTETLLETAPFVSGISPLPNGTTVPYPLCTAQQYAHVVATSDLWASNFVLMADIDLGTLAPPPSTTSFTFDGVFEGNDKALSNYTIADTAGVGVFGKLGANGIIRNLVLRDFNVSGVNHVGALVRENHGLIEHVTGINLTVSGTSTGLGANIGFGGVAGLNNGTLSDVTASVNVSGGIDGNGIGGLVGRQGRAGLGLSGFLLDCMVSGSVTRLEGPTPEQASTGGVAGLLEQGGITNTHSAATVVSPLGRTGGLAGTSNGGPIVGSSASGSVTAGGVAAGGLVGLNHGIIQESFSTSDVSGTAYVGGLVGLAEGPSDISDSHATGNVLGSQYVGGLCGRNGAIISTSYATGDVEGAEVVGGLVGYHRLVTASITQSWASGATSTSGDDAGGLVGVVVGQVDASHARGVVSGAKNVGGLAGRVEVGAVVRDCASTSSSVSGAANVGGLVGNLAGVAERCFATGDVTADTKGGGFVGAQSGSAIDSYATGGVSATVTKAGGFAGQLRLEATVVRAYAAGAVTGASPLGGFAAEMIDASSLEDCHFNTTENPGLNAVGSNPGAAGVSARSAGALRQQGTFTGWDFADVWGILEGTSYPFLRPVPNCANGGCGLGCPCPAGECTTHANCAFGQVCGESNGGYFEEDPDADVCWDPHCETNERDQLCGDAGAPCGSCYGLSCDDGGCGPECPCDSGEGTCNSNSDCEAPAICVQGNGPRYGHAADVSVCEHPLCSSLPHVLGCGFEGAPCGIKCTSRTPCSEGCAVGEACGVGMGRLFGEVVRDVCVDVGCLTDPVGTGCGTLQSECGVCDTCQASCDTKVCGGSAEDGCGGYCTGFCDDREPGCQQDGDCGPGSACVIGGGARVGEAAGANVCLPVRCEAPEVQAPDCGTTVSVCGLCPTCEPVCGDRECGPDPQCGLPCGSGCAAGEYCATDGHCDDPTSENDDPISVDDGTGGTRDITPLEPPTANDGIGATPGGFAVDARGNATYTIPLEVPPGRAGLKPTLALSYSSEAGNDLLGLGWSIQGLSVISRCQRTFARDGAAGPIRNDWSDVFCLDGQRLVRVPESVRGQLEFRTDVDSFAKIIAYGEGGSGPSRFKVWTRDGRILSYGSNENAHAYSSMDDPKGVRAWGLDRMEDRAGNRIDISYEKHGESERGATEEFLPSQYSYGGNATIPNDRSIRFVYDLRPEEDRMRGFAPGGAPIARNRRVTRVEASVRDTITRTYNIGYDQAPNGVVRLISLQECLPPASNPKCKDATIFDYHWESFDFTSDTGASTFPVPLLPGVVLDIDNDGDHDLKASGIHYNGGFRPSLSANERQLAKIGADVVLMATGNGSWSLPANIGIDLYAQFTGKKRTVYIPPALYRATSDPTNPVVIEAASEDETCVDANQHFPGSTARAAVDVDGDGVDEVRALCNWSSNAECMFVDPLWPVTSSIPLTYYPEWMVDLNGDGVSDYVHCLSAFGQSLAYALRDPATGQLGPESTLEVPIAVCLPSCARVSKENPWVTIDVDGDGVNNLAFFDPGISQWAEPTGWWALHYESGQAELRPVDSLPAPSSEHDLLTLDINGDGFRDIVQLSSDWESGDPFESLVSLNTTNGFRRDQQVAIGDMSFAGSHLSWTFDFDRNGKEDILHPVTSSGIYGYWVWRRAAGKGHSELLTSRLDMPEYSTPSMMLDINGDGDLDIVVPWTDGQLRVYYGHGRKNNLLTKVVDGVGRRVDVTYSVETLEDPECVSEWPIQCLPKSPRPLVRSFKEGHAPVDQHPLDLLADSERLRVYGYYSPRVGAAGHGWQGFSKVQFDDFRCTNSCEVDPVLTSSTVLEYEPVRPIPMEGGVVYPFAGKVHRSFVRSPVERSEIEDPGTVGLYDRKISTFDWDLTMSADGRPFAHLRQVVTTTSIGDVDPDSGEVASSTTTTREVDAYGNLDREVRSGLYWGETVDPTFRPADPENWLISLPERVEYTSDYIYAPSKLRIVDYTYDEGLLATITIQPHDPELKLTATLGRDELKNVDHITYEDTDPETNDREQYFEYDDRGIFPLVSYDSRQLVTQYRYDERHGQVTLVVDPNGIETKYAYDGFGRLREVVAPEGRVELDFEDASDIADATLPTQASYKVVRRVNGLPESETEYDAFGRIGRTLTRGYDNSVVLTENVYHGGLLFRATRPHLSSDDQGYTEYSYDAANRLINVLHPGGDESEQWFYANSASLAGEYSYWMGSFDAQNVVAHRGPNLALEVLVTNETGSPVASVDALGNRTNYRPGASNTTQQIAIDGNFTGITTDAFGRTTHLSDPVRGENEFTYSAFGETIKHVDGSGASHEYFYDDVGRMERLVDADGTTLFAYDGSGPNEIDRLVSAISPDGHVTEFDYQPPEGDRNRGLLEGIHRTFQGETFSETIEYDESSRIIAHQYPAAAGIGFGVSYHYNEQHGYLEEIRNATSGDAFWTYDAAYQGYRIKRDILGNGTRTERAFEQHTGELLRIQTTSQDVPIHDVSYTYENYNVRTRTNELDPTSLETFHHDEHDRLHLVEREGPDLDYELDAIGNLTAQTGVGVYEYSGPDADEGYLLRGVDGATDYFYDDNGTAIQRTGPLVHNGAQQIIPNAFDLPKSVEMSGVGQTIDFEYSAFGERAAKLGPVGASGNTLYVGESYRREQLDPDVDAFLHHYRVFAGNRQVAQVTRIEINGTVPAEAVRYLHHDLVGSVEVITDESGNVVHSQRFDPFGNTDNPSWASTFILTGFTGHEHDPDLGLINMKGRLYDPAIGRFISADPYVQYPLWSQSLNRYSYGFNNPMSGSDPSGYAWDVDGWMDKVFGNSTGWESATLPAYLGLVTLGASAGGLAASNFGGGVAGIATSGSDYAGLYDMPSEYTGPAPMGAFGGSQGGMYNGGAMAPAAGPDMRVAQAGGQDVLGPFVVTGSTDPPVIIPPSPPPLRLSDPTGMRPNQWSTLPPLVNIGVSASAMSTIASFFYPLSGGLSGGGAGFGVFIDTSRASIGLYSRIDGRFAAGHYAGISGEVGATLDANAFFGEGDSNFVEFGKGSTFGGRTSGSFGSGGSVSFSRGRGYGFAVGKSYSYTWRLLEWSPL